MVVLGFSEFNRQGRALAEQLSCPYREIEVRRFPDGEALVKIPTPLPDRIIICRSLNHPDEKLIEVLLAAKTAREHGVEFISLVAPFLCYMRQDKSFQPGEAVSQSIIGKLIAQMVDEVITVDAHLHRVTHLNDAVPCARAVNLSSTPFMARFLRQNVNNPLLVGPDRESEQWVAALARTIKIDWIVCDKQRLGDRRVHVALPHNTDVSNRCAVIIDDMVATGHTIAETAKTLRAAGASTIHCMVTHPLFVDGADQLLTESGITNIWSSDSVTHQSNVIELAPLLAQAFKPA